MEERYDPMMKVRSNGMEVRSNGRKVRSNGMKVRSNGTRIRSNGMQVTIRLHFCPECPSIAKQTNHRGGRKFKRTEIQIQRALKLSNEGNQLKET